MWFNWHRFWFISALEFALLNEIFGLFEFVAVIFLSGFRLRFFKALMSVTLKTPFKKKK